MTVKRLIGYGYTDSSGVATIDYDASGTALDPSGYTGIGAGEIDVMAELHDDSSVVSVPCEVYDYINYDNGLQDDYQNIWTGNTEDLTRQSDGSLFSSTSARKLLSSVLISGDFEATFEADGTNSPLWGVQDGNGNITRFYMRNDGYYNYYKITRVDGTITAKYSANGTTWTTLTANQSNVTSADCYFLFQNNSGTKSIKFKNVKIYPI